MKSYIRLKYMACDPLQSIRRGDSLIIGFTTKKRADEFRRETLWMFPWVAEIKDLCPKFTYKRNFIKPTIDWRESNSKGSKNVFGIYIVENGHLYQIKENLCTKRSVVYFCKINDNGEAVKISEQEIRCALN